jgi:hypothetical protein
MRLRLLSFVVVILILAAACQGPPPTVIYIVLSPTPDANGGVIVTPEPNETTTPTATPTATTTSTPDPFPTTTFSQIQVAEEKFEHGALFWLQPVGQIWVLVEDEDDPEKGVWTVYDDTFIEGQPEFDPSIEPPEDLFQPERGFGKLWRENPEIRKALGWAIEPEFGHVTRYEYRPGGEVTEGNEYVQAPGYHLVTDLLGQTYRLNEADGTWEITD